MYPWSTIPELEPPPDKIAVDPYRQAPPPVAKPAPAPEIKIAVDPHADMRTLRAT